MALRVWKACALQLLPGYFFLNFTTISLEINECLSMALMFLAYSDLTFYFYSINLYTVIIYTRNFKIFLTTCSLQNEGFKI